MALEHVILKALKVEDEVQIRVVVRDDVITRYYEMIMEGSDPPPLSGTRLEDGTILLDDGRHRKDALERAGRTEYMVNVKNGGKFQALISACDHNALIGLTLTRADRRRAATLILSHPEGYAMSNREIAKRVGMTHPTVGEIRREMYGKDEAEDVDAPPPPPAHTQGTPAPTPVVSPDDASMAYGAAPDGWSDPGSLTTGRSGGSGSSGGYSSPRSSSGGARSSAPSGGYAPHASPNGAAAPYTASAATAQSSNAGITGIRHIGISIVYEGEDQSRTFWLDALDDLPLAIREAVLAALS